jgi:hypothetical protein
MTDRILAEHVEQKRKPGTVAFYRHLLDNIIKPELGATKADKVTRVQVARLHGKLKAPPSRPTAYWPSSVDTASQGAAALSPRA